MMNKYLNKDPIPWLLEKVDPHIRYLTLRDLLNADISTDKMKSEYRELQNSSRAKYIFQSNRDGIIGDKKNFDAFYRGTLWYLAEMVEMGFDRRENYITNAGDFLLHQYQMSTGGITLKWKPKVEVACKTGEVLQYLIRAGFSDERIDKGIEWITKNQRFDGGWLHCPVQGIVDVVKFLFLNRSGTGLKKEESLYEQSCIYASIACTKAVLLQRSRKKNLNEIISKACEYFLRNRLFGDIGSDNHIPICCRYKKSDFTRIGYPVLFQYDILEGLRIITNAGYFLDKRTGNAFNMLIEKQNSEGRWCLENMEAGMLFGNEKKKLYRGKENKWVTLNVMRFFKHAGF